MSIYHELLLDINECKNDKDLLKIVQYIMDNKKKHQLDEVDLDKLEQAGMRKYEQFERERQALHRNKRFGN